jgi:hypothetical protein
MMHFALVSPEKSLALFVHKHPANVYRPIRDGKLKMVQVMHGRLLVPRTGWLELLKTK